MNTGTRRQFTAAFKRKVIEFAEVNGNMAAQRQFGVSEKSVRYWRNQKSKLSVCNARKTSFRGRRAVHPELEDKVADFVREYRAKSLPVNAELIRSKAVELAREAGLSKKDFKGSIYWICSGCQKYGASIRCHLPDCGLIFHFPCAAAYGCFQDMKALILLCPSHADKAVSYVGSQANCQSCEEMVSMPELLFCTVCGAHYHGFCLDPPVVVTPTSRLGWQCPDCKTCQGCRRAGDEARLLTCDVCDKAFHVYCVKPMVANVPKHGWKCQSCRVCGDCGSRTPGSGPSSRWHMNYSVCDSCYQQRNKGVACPLCGKAYRQFSNRADMAQCTVCRKFIHVECDSQLVSSPKDGDYVCPVCCNMRQQAALSLSGKSELSVRLRVPASDGSPDYMYSSQKDIASCGNDDSRSSNDYDVLQQTSSGGMQSPENESKFPPPSHHSLGKPPFARFPGKRRFGVGRARASSGKFAAKRRAKAVELRRKRGPKPKLKPYYPCWNVSQS
ncbi:hypothetical protein HPB51_020647 [Rhipicephalus microplus]|uniref:Uncharacterized protein n=1 Tax=Rhipicephalus microplus TaxID=6941 RepID=A0A9J6DPV2_RHIMP|nr:hypothetical protein HPB51_020647 [Rhipicephalus microplus]